MDIDNSVEIESVQISGGEYLLNGSINVPEDPGNRHYRAIQEWIAEGNEPGPEHTPAQLLGRLVAEKRQQINEDRDSVLQAGVAYAHEDWTDTVQTRPGDQTNLLAMRIAAESALAAGVSEPVLEFRGLANVQRLLTPQQMVDMTNTVLAYCQQVYRDSWARKDALDAIDLEAPDAAEQIGAV